MNILKGLGKTDKKDDPKGKPTDGKPADGKPEDAAKTAEDAKIAAAMSSPQITASFGTPNKTVMIVGGAVVAVALIIGIVSSLGGKQPEITKPTIAKGVRLGSSIEDRIETFMKSMTQQVADLKKAHEDDKNTITLLRGRIDLVEKKSTETLTAVVEEFKKQAGSEVSRLQRIVEEQANARPKTATPEELKQAAERERILGDFRRNFTDRSTKMTKVEAEDAARKSLIAAGYDEATVRNMLATFKAKELGADAIGDVAEPPPSKTQLESIPSWTKPFVEEATGYTNTIASYDRILDPDSVKKNLVRFLRQKSDKTIAGEELDAFYDVVRVRRENIPAKWHDYLPMLMQQKQMLGIRNRDTKSIADLIYQNREVFGQVVNAGQLLTLVQFMARGIDPVDSGKGEIGNDPTPGFKAITEGQTANMGQVVDQALETNWTLNNREPGGLFVVAKRTSDTFLENARAAMTPEAQTSFLSKRVTAFLDAKHVRGGQSVATPGGVRQPPGIMAANPGPTAPPGMMPGGAPSTATGMVGGAGMGPAAKPAGSMRAGGVTIGKAQFRNAVMLMTPGIIADAGLVPGSDESMAAQICLWEQNQRLVEAAYPEASAAADPVGTAANILRPAMIDIAKAGSTLVAVKVGHADQRAAPEDKTAIIAYVAGRVGSVIHDRDAATKVLNEIDAAFRSTNPPDLSQVKRAITAAKANAISADGKTAP